MLAVKSGNRTQFSPLTHLNATFRHLPIAIINGYHGSVSSRQTGGVSSFAFGASTIAAGGLPPPASPAFW
jgi:hypothetical protein